MSDVTLSAGVRNNLLALQNISKQEATTQQRLATGKKVNSALDNPTEYFTASSLSSRAGELTNLLDSMTNAVNTINAASNGLTSITTTIQSMEATITQARQDASWQSTSYTLNTTGIGSSSVKSIGFSGGAVGSTAVNVSLNDTETVTGSGGFSAAGNTLSAGGTITVQAADINGGSAISVTLTTNDTATTAAAAINAAAGATVASVNSNQLVLTDPNAGNKLTVGGSAVAAAGLATTSTATASNADTVDQLVSLINGNSSLAGKIKASNNAGQLQIQNLSTSALTVTGVGSNGQVDGGTGTNSIAGNALRANLVTQFNGFRDQLDKTATDSSFNGINLLNGDQLKVFFNESSTSTLTIQSTNTNGVSSNTLSIGSATNAEFQDNNQLDTRLQSLHNALNTVASQASNFGANLSIVENRQDFTNSMINTLTTGATGLTAADTNLEGANMLALQTQQQLSITSLSLASQANQAVLRLFG
jgi:flagellin-like hook-associated protein FlgL